jgi:mannitol/fructose-specific phosphotransferase system IIA component (Ntr-type)
MADTQLPLLDETTVSCRRPLGSTTEEVVRALAEQLREAGRVADVEAFVADVLAREAMGSTTLPGGNALPHARSAAVTESTLAVATLPVPVELAPGHRTDLVLLLAVPQDQEESYLDTLRKVATALVKPAFRLACLAAEDSAELAAAAQRAVR